MAKRIKSNPDTMTIYSHANTVLELNRFLLKERQYIDIHNF